MVTAAAADLQPVERGKLYRTGGGGRRPGRGRKKSRKPFLECALAEWRSWCWGAVVILLSVQVCVCLCVHALHGFLCPPEEDGER